ncbi:hypothetical protein OMK64_03990 [Cellulomonas fimi]|uniref:hypothetical protein n=1 Tax=Cellulomonas fimi TaxID=1708 RepID=UPI00234D16AD|nr:hypothetical protein [Cellulomonas fimi]MDC7120693.1 hypothetical protein [Cellulomonas fimi]
MAREPGRRSTRARVLAAALLVAGIAAVGGCAGAPTVTRQAEARVAVQADCLDPEVVHELGLVLEDRTASADEPAPVATPGAVPEDFVPSSVLVCSASGTLKSASGTWAAVTESRREGDLGPLLAALERPSQEPSGACETSGAVPTVLWLVDALGRAVRPVWPTDACGAPVADVLAALDALDETDTTDFPVERVTPTGPPSGR